MNVEVFKGILDSIPYPIVFVDTKHIIRYLNMRAEYVYYNERGYSNLIGKSLFVCHNEKSKEMIIKTVERFRKDKKAVFLKVNDRNERIYITPVKDSKGNLIGYFERFEANFKV